MNLTTVVAQLLQDAELGEAGKSLFVFNAPDKVKRCLLILSDLEGTLRDEDLPGYKKEKFKVIVRNPDHHSALTIAKQVVATLDLHRLTVGGLAIQRMRATHDPIAFPVPDSDVTEVSVNMWACYVEL